VDPIWQVVLTVFGGGVVAWALDEMRSRREAPKTQSEVASHYADAAESSANASKASADSLASVLGRLTILEATVAAQQRTLSKWRGWASNVVTAFNTVTAQLRELGQEPRATIPPPPIEDTEEKNGS